MYTYQREDCQTYNTNSKYSKTPLNGSKFYEVDSVRNSPTSAVHLTSAACRVVRFSDTECNCHFSVLSQDFIRHLRNPVVYENNVAINSRCSTQIHHEAISHHIK